MLARTALVILLLCTAACTVVRPVHLYPVSGVAPTSGVVQGEIVGHGQGHGVATVAMPDGEHLSGDYSIVFGGSVGFGSIFASVYGPHGTAFGNANSTNISMSNEGQGSISLIGDKGTSMTCEFLNANMTGHGYGACQTSSGATYRMIY